MFHFKGFQFALQKNSQSALLGTFVGLGAVLPKIQVFSCYFEEASLMFPCAFFPQLFLEGALMVSLYKSNTLKRV